MTDLEIKHLGNADRARWDTFVESCPEASFFHLSGWQRVIATALGHRTDYLYAQRGEEIVGVLPLAQVKSLLFGNALTSVPFCVYGGVAANDAEAAAALCSSSGGGSWAGIARTSEAAISNGSSRALQLMGRRQGVGAGLRIGAGRAAARAGQGVAA